MDTQCEHSTPEYAGLISLQNPLAGKSAERPCVSSCVQVRAKAFLRDGNWVIRLPETGAAPALSELKPALQGLAIVLMRSFLIHTTESLLNLIGLEVEIVSQPFDVSERQPPVNSPDISYTARIITPVELELCDLARLHQLVRLDCPVLNLLTPSRTIHGTLINCLQSAGLE